MRAMSDPAEVLQAALALEPRERADLVDAIAATLTASTSGQSGKAKSNVASMTLNRDV